MSYIERYRPREGESHNKILVVTGIPGSGKDYLLSQAAEQGLIHPSVRTTTFSEELFTYLKSMYPNLKTRDDIRNLLSQDEVRSGIVKIVDRIIQSQPAALNTHVVYSQRESLVANPDIDKRINPCGYLFVWSEPDQIIAWRTEDRTRERPAEKIDDIATHQDIALEVVSVVAKHTGASLKTIWNRYDNVYENLAVIHDLTDNIVL